MSYKAEEKKLVFKFEIKDFKQPIGLAVKNNYHYVADSGNNRIQVLKIDSEGNLIAQSTFGKKGKELGEFEFERFLDLAVKDNYLYVADSGNNRIQVLEIKY